jgi:uroporphyrinogen decarboxylase
METMTGFERMRQFFKRKPMDRIPFFDNFWDGKIESWVRARLMPNTDATTHFAFDMRETGGTYMEADLDFQPQVLEEDEDTRVILDRNFTIQRWHKKHPSAPEHIDFLIKTRRDWEEKVKPLLLQPDPRRIHPEWYRADLGCARTRHEYLCYTDYHAFSCVYLLVGHIGMLTALHDDPDWVREIMDTYGDLYIHLYEDLVASEGRPDGFCLYEDMGFNGHAFLSPAMYRELIRPTHHKFIDWAHGLGCPVTMHASGCVTRLVPEMLSAGMDCLQTISGLAGMDLIRLYQQFGDRLSFIGGIDGRELASGSRARIDTELVRKVPVVKTGYGYCLHSDFSIPMEMGYEDFLYFSERGLEIGRY